VIGSVGTNSLTLAPRVGVTFIACAGDIYDATIRITGIDSSWIDDVRIGADAAP